MRLSKRVTAVTMASMMVLPMAGCRSKPAKTTVAPIGVKTEATTGATSEAVSEAATTAAEATGDTTDVIDKRIGISAYKSDDNFMILYRTRLERYLTEDLGLRKENIAIQDGKSDQTEQTNQIQSFVTQRYDVLILNLAQTSSAPGITDMRRGARIPAIFINREPGVAKEERWTGESINATHIDRDTRQSGTYQGEEILETSNKGNINGDNRASYIMIQGGPENVDTQYRTKFSVKALTDVGVEAEELLKQHGDWGQAKVQQIVQDASDQYGDKIKAIFYNNDVMALGALQTIETTNRKVNEDIYLVGVDALIKVVQNVLEGKQTGTMFNDHPSQARMTADNVVQFPEGEKIEPVDMVDCIKVTKDSAQRILDQLK